MKKQKGRSPPGDPQPETQLHHTHNSPDTPPDLRRRAEEALAGKHDQTADLDGAGVRRLIHELQIHQIELEMQNESLRQTQVELEAARDRYWDLFEMAPVGYLMLSSKGVIVEANMAAAALLEIDRGQLLKTPMTAYILREDQDIFYLGVQQARQENKGQEFELRLATHTGKPLLVALKCSPVEEQGQMRITLSDITRRKQQERELAANANRLENLNQELERFADVIAHDLKEPLRKIKGFGNFLVRDYGVQLDERGQEYLARMQHATDRMEKLIEALLSLARLSNQEPRFQAVDLNQVVQAVLADLEFQLSETGGQLELGTLPRLTAEPTQMQQLFQNLIGNALKFHQPGIPPRVQIHARQIAAGEVEILVSDQGIGFEPEAADRIFKPFVRLHGKNKYEGTGMGLTICRRIVESHGGTIAARSAPGQGATFIITLPLQPPGVPDADG